MKLHLGCGQKHIPGFVNVDIQKLPGVDLVSDIAVLPFEKNSVDLIYSCANLEHFSRHEWVDVLRCWYGVLKPGGVLQLSTADFEACCHQYFQNRNVDELIGLVSGGQKDWTDRHGMIFDFHNLSVGLKMAGFGLIHRVSWQKFVPYLLDASYDDYSKAYLPHLDTNGRCMMLNIQARKIG